MPTPPVPEELLREAVAAYSLYPTKSEAAKSLGIPRGTFSNRLAAAQTKNITTDAATKFSIEDKGDEQTIYSISSAVRTVEDAIAKGGIDLKIWRVDRSKVNSWPTTMKGKDGDPVTVNNWQVTVWLKRKAPQYIQEGIQELLAEMKSNPTPYPTVTRTESIDPCMLEISLFDTHFGKLCWGTETGTPYDLKIAEETYVRAAEDLLEMTESFDIEKILIPVGQDFFHVDSWSGGQGTTTRGTPIESTDDRFQKVFQSGCRAVQWLIERCRNTADVEVLWVPGNHDWVTSWHLTEWLTAKFVGDIQTTFDNSPSPRKYVSYGCNLLGFTHGDKEKHHDLPLLMAVESPDEFAKATCREWHLGHHHRAKETRYLFLDERGGVRVRILPSLSGTDSWHWERGYTHNQRAAEAYLWSRQNGFRAYLSALV